MLWKLNFITNWVLNSITEFWPEDMNKRYLWERTLVDQEWHLVLKMPISETAHIERRRENTPAK
jgi:hypothetical protein